MNSNQETESPQGNNAVSGTTQADNADWERRTLTTLVFSALKEQRRARRWNIFFRLFFFAYLTFFVVAFWPDNLSGEGAKGAKHTALVQIDGVISSATTASAENVIAGLREAFEDKNTAGLILQINSPGGSPVQSGRINQEILRLKKKHPDIPVITVIDDICASGGYYIAVAGDKIYADKASLVGSIGVIMNGFGFVDTMDKLGVERRLMVAGENKGFLDPFSPVKEDELAHVEGLLGEIHQQFVDVVKAGRGDRLQEGKKLFSGLVWSGAESVELGLTDGLGDADYVAREVIGADKIVNYTRREDFFSRVSRSMGHTMGKTFLGVLDATRPVLQ